MSDPLPAAPATDDDPTRDQGITVLRWPAEAQRRGRLAAAGQPRLLLVDAGADVPVLVDDLEDWVRCPSDPEDLVIRMDALRRRGVERAMVPVVDDGLLRFDGHWVNIPDRQLALVTLLVRRFGRLVPSDEVAAVYGNAQRSSVKTAVVRIRARVARVGLRLHVLRGRGVLLEAERKG
jgi:hypothetical protein